MRKLMLTVMYEQKQTASFSSIFRDEISQIRNTNPSLQSLPPVHQTRAQNDHLTVKWLKNSVSELRTEVGELQRALNATVVLQNREEFEAEIELLRSDVRDLNRERDAMRRDKEATVELTRRVEELRKELEEVSGKKMVKVSFFPLKVKVDGGNIKHP